MVEGPLVAASGRSSDAMAVLRMVREPGRVGAHEDARGRGAAAPAACLRLRVADPERLAAVRLGRDPAVLAHGMRPLRARRTGRVDGDHELAIGAAVPGLPRGHLEGEAAAQPLAVEVVRVAHELDQLAAEAVRVEQELPADVADRVARRRALGGAHSPGCGTRLTGHTARLLRIAGTARCTGGVLLACSGAGRAGDEESCT